MVLAVAAGASAYVGWDFFAGRGGLAFEGADDTGYYLWGRSLVVDRDVDFRNDLASAPSLTDEARAEWYRQETPSGNIANKYPPGWAIASLPALFVGHWIAPSVGAPQDGWSAPYALATWLFHAGFAVVGLWAAWRLASRFAPSGVAACGVLLVWLASPLVYYHVARYAMSHGLIFNLTAVLWLITARIREKRERPWEWWLLGLCAGLLAITRATAVLAVAWTVWEVVRRVVQENGNAGRGELFYGIARAGIAGASLVTVGWLLVVLAHGDWFPEPYPGEQFSLRTAAWLEVLFSARHGVFYWHPGLLLALIGLGLAWSRLSLGVLATFMVAGVALYIVNASWWCWWFGSSFGNRAFDLWWLIGMCGASAALARKINPWTRVSVGAASCAAILLNIGWLVAWLAQTISRTEAVTYEELFQSLRQTFSEVFLIL
jgi:hypothetical protein